MPRFVLSEAAAGDLRDIHDYIAADDPAAARRVLEDIRTAMHRSLALDEARRDRPLA